MKKIIKFQNLETRPYTIINEELPCPDGCCTDLKEEIKNKNTATLSDLISDIANDCIDIYTQSLLENCSKLSFISYIEEAKQYNPVNFENQLRLAQYLYYDEILNKNLEAVVHNALVSLMKSKCIILKGSEYDINYAEKHFKKYITTLIENAEINTLFPASAIVEDFERELAEHIANYTRHTSQITVSYNDSSDDNISALLLVPDKEPKVIQIPVVNQLKEMQKLVGGNIEYIPLHSNRADGLMIDLVCNEEGKINALPQNRCITVADITGENSKEVVDVICGTAIVMAANDEGEQVDLPPEEIEKWAKVFECPLPAFIGSMILEDESFEVPDFFELNEGIIDINKQRGDNNER